MLRVIRELQPKWVVGENVPGVIKIALDDILDSIEAEGYTTQTYSYPVSLLGACHKRERIFVVAHSKFAGIGCDCGTTSDKRREPCNSGGESIRQTDGEIGTSGIDAANTDAPHTHNSGSGTQRVELNGNGQEIDKGQDINDPHLHPERLQGYRQSGECTGEIFASEGAWKELWFEVATRLCRVDDGVPKRVDRLRCLGNSVVPQQVYPVLKVIADIERGDLNGA